MELSSRSRRVTKGLSATPKRRKPKKKKKISAATQQSLDLMCCPKCKKPLAEAGQVRLQSRPKLTVRMQKLLRKRRDSDTESSLTNRQRGLLRCAMQHSNILMLRCISCKWKCEVQLNNRQASQNQKAQLKQRTEAEKQANSTSNEEVLDKQQMKKKKKKEKRKKAAAAKIQELEMIKRPVQSTSSPLPPRTQSKPPAPQPVTTPASRRKDKQQLRNVLHAKKKESLSAGESLSLFLDSLK